MFVIKNTIKNLDDTSCDAIIGGTFFVDNVIGFVFDEIRDVFAGGGGE